MSEIDRSRPPAPGPSRDFDFPTFEHRRAPAGLEGVELYAAPRPEAPILALQLVLPSGGVSEPSDRAGLASLTSALLDEGTARWSGPEIARRIERHGASLSTGCDWDATYVSVTVRPRHLDAVLEVLAEIVSRPTFPDEAVERTRGLKLSEILRRRSEPEDIAIEHFAHRVYGGTPYGRPLIGRATTVGVIDRETVAEFHRSELRRADAILVAAGAFETETLVARLAEVLSDWPSEPPSSPPDVDPPRREAPVVRLVDRAGAAQTELLLGHPGPSAADPDRIPLSVMNAILGGKFTSRLNLNLRERHGYTYGASSSFSSRRGPGPFQVSTAVATEHAGAAAREAIGEIERLRDDGVGSDERDDAVRYLLGVIPYSLQSSSAVASKLTDLAVLGRPDDFYHRLPERLRAVSPEDVLEVARRHLRPSELVVVAVGPAEELQGQFDGIGEIEVVEAPLG